MQSIHNEPIFLLPKDHDVVKRISAGLNHLRNAPNHDLRMVVKYPELYHEIVVPTQDFFIGLQHYQELIEKFVFAIDFAFEKPNANGQRYEGHDWKGEEAAKWFYLLSQAFPAAIFFISDEDARFFALMGDLIAQRKIPIIPIKKEVGRVFLDHTMLYTLHQRLYNSCCFFTMYCHGSPINPRKYVEALIANYGMDFSYDDVYSAFVNRVQSGGRY